MVKATIKLLLVYLLYPVAFVYSQAEDKSCIPEPTDMLIQYGDLISCRIEPVGDLDVFRFLGSVGEVIIVQASRRSGGSPCVDLRDPDGVSIGSGCGDYAARLNNTLQKPGVHTVVVSEKFDDGTMEYGLVLERVAPPSPTATPLCFGCNISDEINGIGDLDLYIFNGSPGDAVIVQASGRSGGSPCVELRDPDGVSIGSGCGDSAARLSNTLQKPGVHTVVVSEKFDDGTMEYRVDLQCVSGQCPPLPPPSNTADLSISKTDSPDPVTVGSILTYTIVVTNNGSSAATGVHLRDTLSGGAKFGSVTADQGSCSLSKNEVVCDLGVLVNGATATVTIDVTPTVVGVIANRALVQAIEPDPDLCDNTVKAVTTVQPFRRSHHR